jgi:hypothetical protein
VRTTERRHLCAAESPLDLGLEPKAVDQVPRCAHPIFKRESLVPEADRPCFAFAKSWTRTHEDLSPVPHPRPSCSIVLQARVFVAWRKPAGRLRESSSAKGQQPTRSPWAARKSVRMPPFRLGNEVREKLRLVASPARSQADLLPSGSDTL